MFNIFKEIKALKLGHLIHRDALDNNHRRIQELEAELAILKYELAKLHPVTMGKAPNVKSKPRPKSKAKADELKSTPRFNSKSSPEAI